MTTPIVRVFVLTQAEMDTFESLNPKMVRGNELPEGLNAALETFGVWAEFSTKMSGLFQKPLTFGFIVRNQRAPSLDIDDDKWGKILEVVRQYIPKG
jgi:hypothetical protein